MFFGPNLISTTPYSLWNDVLSVFPSARREPPLPTATAGPTPPPGTPGWFTTSEWARGMRLQSPIINDCTIFSATSMSDPTTAANRNNVNRMCRAGWQGLSSLFTIPGNPVSSAPLFVDFRQDRCEGAVYTGTTEKTQFVPSVVPLPSNGASYPTPYPSRTLSVQQASDALPTGALFMQGWLPLFMSAPQPCTTNLDCTSYNPQNPFSTAYANGPPSQFDATCIDMDTQAINLQGPFGGRIGNPFGYFLFGGYTPGTYTNGATAQGQCGSAQNLKGSLRAVLLGLGGWSRPSYYPPISTDDRFCFPDFAQLKNAPTWASTQYNDVNSPGTCTAKTYWDPARLCLTGNSPGGAVYPGGPPNGPVYFNGPFQVLNPQTQFQLGQGVNVPQMINTQYDALYVPWNNVGPGTFYSSSPTAYPRALPYSLKSQFSLSLPYLTGITFTNSVKEQLRWAIASGLAEYQVGGVPLDAIRIDNVWDAPAAFSPLPAPPSVPQQYYRAGIVVLFTVSAPNAVIMSNVTYQMAGTYANQPNNCIYPNTFSCPLNLGKWMAQSGIIPDAFANPATGISASPYSPPVPPYVMPPVQVFFIVIFVLLVVGITVHFVVLKPRGIKTPIMPSFAKWGEWLLILWGFLAALPAAAYKAGQKIVVVHEKYRKRQADLAAKKPPPVAKDPTVVPVANPLSISGRLSSASKVVYNVLARRKSQTLEAAAVVGATAPVTAGSSESAGSVAGAGAAVDPEGGASFPPVSTEGYVAPAYIAPDEADPAFAEGDAADGEGVGADADAPEEEADGEAPAEEEAEGEVEEEGAEGEAEEEGEAPEEEQGEAEEEAPAEEEEEDAEAEEEEAEASASVGGGSGAPAEEEDAVEEEAVEEEAPADEEEEATGAEGALPGAAEETEE